jgi:protein-tyrosine kinase
MSRIYEALQKAESERKLDQREEPGTPEHTVGAAMSATAAVAEPEDRVFTASGFSETSIVGDPYREPSTRHADGELLDLSKIPARPWALSLAQLPSLLERGPAVEQFRSLRSRIFELRDISPLKTILVSSGLPQEGKSFVSTNLALSLARHKNSKVLLIDGDMRRYTLHQILGWQITSLAKQVRKR